jgi:hypothetical protein
MFAQDETITTHVKAATIINGIFPLILIVFSDYKHTNSCKLWMLCVVNLRTKYLNYLK